MMMMSATHVDYCTPAITRNDRRIVGKREEKVFQTWCFDYASDSSSVGTFGNQSNGEFFYPPFIKISITNEHSEQFR